MATAAGRAGAQTIRGIVVVVVAYLATISGCAFHEGFPRLSALDPSRYPESLTSSQTSRTAQSAPAVSRRPAFSVGRAEALGGPPEQRTESPAGLPKPQPALQVVKHEKPNIAAEPKEKKPKAKTAPILPEAKEKPDNACPIDLPTALRLAGANNLQIALAQERLSQAEARLEGARALWLPSLNAGAAYNSHSGQIQDTQGEILDLRRNSLFVGGGPVMVSGGLNGGTNGPARLMLGLPISDAVFENLAGRRLVEASRFDVAATFNDTLLRVGLSYLDLVAAHQQTAIVADALANAKELVRLVESRVKAGTALPADGLRAKGDLAGRERQIHQAQESFRVASAELVRQLRLDPMVALIPAETQPAPIELVDVNTPLPALLEQGLLSRPELAQNRALVDAAVERLRQEKWRPWLPTLQVGYSVGGFGGGAGTTIGRFSERADFDALLVWELRNLGFGNRAQQRERNSQHRQTHLTAEQTQDNIVAEIVRAYHQVVYRRKQMESAQEQFKAAKEALPLNFKGILDGNLRAIEAQQAVQGLADGQRLYLNAVIEYNLAQFQLLRAIGRPLTELK